MGEHKVHDVKDSQDLGRFQECLLDDLRALEEMLQAGMIESGVRRIGAEQEVFLIDEHMHPAPRAMDILERIEDPLFTTELGRFNLEFNLTPIRFESSCLGQLEEELNRLLDKLRSCAAQVDTEILLAGILPTLTRSDLTLDNMTPKERYFALNRAIQRLRGDQEFQLRIKGVDELILTDNSVMLESCNTSFQIHFQVGAEEFARLYNVAQVATAPVLAVATNSPLLFGRNLWRETRIALFQQAADTRRATRHMRQSRPRVGFGTRWVDGSVLEIFREDIAHFRILIGRADCEESLAEVRQGRPPKLTALQSFNGSVYRWNRPCYGVHEGQAHLRIENRVLPAGPTIADQVANAAFFFGLMCGISDQYPDVRRDIAFDEVKANFVAAARMGLQTQLSWFGGVTLPAQDLILEELIPLAREGLQRRGILADQVGHYLDIIAERTRTRQTGSIWLLKTFAAMDRQAPLAERLATLTAEAARNQKEGKPAHGWPCSQVIPNLHWTPNFLRVEQYMTTDVFTVSENETVHLVANVMNWQRIRHIPVENEQGELVGLISYRSLLRFFSREPESSKSTPARDIMIAQPITVEPETATLDAIDLMTRHQIGCLPVVKQGRLVGIITERDFMRVSRELFCQQLQVGKQPS